MHRAAFKVVSWRVITWPNAVCILHRTQHRAGEDQEFHYVRLLFHVLIVLGQDLNYGVTGSL